ncbi:hypothetical protein CVIRNUC_011236 [Coccomyxa viridis]|uniref:Uncharacterized protein n=1 Tax=Coccomyxa viridis TaxID=1274662 RepID=A0AAV1IPR6_9CHLO|nr:hypothetical protein CVIRNUC_011236 [Coccomyxa viridis]
MAYREESLSVAGSLAPGSSIASSSIHMLSLGSSSLGSMKSSSCRLGTDNLEPAGVPDEAWHRLCRRLGNQRACSEPATPPQVLGKVTEDLLPPYMNGASDGKPLQEGACQPGQSYKIWDSSKMRPPIAPSRQPQRGGLERSCVCPRH